MTNNTHNNHFSELPKKIHPKNHGFHRKKCNLSPTKKKAKRNLRRIYQLAGVFFRFLRLLHQRFRLRPAKAWSTPTRRFSFTSAEWLRLRKNGLPGKGMAKKIGGFFLMFVELVFLFGGGGRMKSIYTSIFMLMGFVSEMQQFYEKNELSWGFLSH